ncbi:MAG: adenylate/guanylate cyclase domain-containing protein [Candidatus Dojkabacteria bacterium]|nr:MAG: adenylate/guanylate cyclase domain-containing protein [Candidatus Dojkabacteria bacterium]
MFNEIKKYKSNLLFFVIASSIILFIFSFGIFENWQVKLNDYLFIDGKANEEIVIIAIDEKTISNLNGWPLSRTHYGNLLEFLNNSSPKVVAFDISFFDTKVEEDQIFIQEVKKASYPIVVSSEIVNNEVLLPFDELHKVTQAGFVNLPPDVDGVIRKAQLIIDKNQNCELSFALKITSLIKKVEINNCKEVFVNDTKITDNQKILINFAGKRKTYLTLSMIDVLNGKYPKDLFNERIVMIGANARNLHDEYFTPIGNEPIPGVEIQANIVDTLLSQKILKTPNFIASLILLLFLGTVSFAIGNKLKPHLGLGLYFSLIFSSFFLSIKFFDLGFILPTFYIILSITLSYFFATVNNFYKKHNEIQKVKNIFKSYVSKDVLNEILENIDNLQLQGKKATITILFSDIRGFTTITENLPAEKLVQELNRYLSLASKEIIKTNGIIDKYIGDAIMAFWGAPIENTNHALNACKSAVGLVKAIEIFNKSRPEWLPEFKIGIGINTGEANVGNIGSNEKLDYTVIGDSVNLASRVESLTKLYDQTILVTENTINNLPKDSFVILKNSNDFKKIDDVLFFRFIDKVIVKGKNKGVKLYSLITKKEALDKINNIEKYEVAYKYYVDGEWDKSLKILSGIKNDGPSSQLIDRIQNNKAQPVKNGWVLTSK